MSVLARAIFKIDSCAAEAVIQTQNTCPEYETPGVIPRSTLITLFMVWKTAPSLAIGNFNGTEDSSGQIRFQFVCWDLFNSIQISRWTVAASTWSAGPFDRGLTTRVGCMNLRDWGLKMRRTKVSCNNSQFS